MSLWDLYVILAVLAALLLSGLWYVKKVRRESEEAIASSRLGDTFETFIASFRPELQPIASAMYAEFQRYTHNGKFPFRKSDRIAEMLRLEQIDLDEELKRVANQFGCRKPSKEDRSKFRGSETFEDYAEFIHFLKSPEAGEQQASGLHTH
jgi:hypothetical protein